MLIPSLYTVLIPSLYAVLISFTRRPFQRQCEADLGVAWLGRQVCFRFIVLAAFPVSLSIPKLLDGAVGAWE